MTWVVVGAILAYLLILSGVSLRHSVVLTVVLVPEYGALCLMAWYPCRATPLHNAGLLRIGVTHIVAAVLFASAWMLLAFTCVYLLAMIPAFAHIGEYTGLLKWVFAAGITLYLLSAALYYVLIANDRSRQAELNANEAQVLAREAELRALKAQINPHFLFNSLHSISALTTIDPARAREMCINLADFLRSTLGLGEKSLVALEEEIALVRRFLTIEKIRFGDRLQIEEQIEPDAISCLVPPLLLQPLLENAVGHGIANLPNGGAVRIIAKNGAGRLTVLVENDFDPEHKTKRRQGIGLANVRERLLARYGKESTFDAEIVGATYRVRISLPAERSHAS